VPPDPPAIPPLDQPRPTGGGGSDYAALSRQIRAVGLLDSRPGYYTAKITANLMLLAGGWAAFALLGDSWWQLATATFLGAVFTQFGFLAHDAGHKQICRTRRAS